MKGFVEQQGGSISVGRSPQGGAEFVVTLPGVAATHAGDCAACGVTVVN